MTVVVVVIVDDDVDSGWVSFSGGGSRSDLFFWDEEEVMMVLEGRPVEGERLLDVPLAEENKQGGKFESPTGGIKAQLYTGFNMTIL